MTTNLGDKVKDTISGAIGIVIARTEWLHGCIRVTIAPQALKDGHPADNFTVDEPQVEALERNAVPNDPFWRDADLRPTAESDDLPRVLKHVIDLDALTPEDCMAIVGQARGAKWEDLRDWLYQIAYHQRRQTTPRRVAGERTAPERAPDPLR